MLRVFASIAIAFAVLVAVASQYEKVQVLEPVPLPEAARKTRLLVLWVDSLPRSAVESGAHLPILRSHLPSALHGPVRECMDAVSVPCLNAMTTGLDRFSLGSLWSNFGGASGLANGSVLGVLTERGLRVGFAADPKVTAAVSGLHWVYEEQAVDDAHMLEVALAAFEREKLDVLVVQLRHLDQVSHKLGPASAEFTSALVTVDAEIERVRKRLRSDDHFVVLGDHGHDELGRHFAGLNVPTYAAFFGPIFSRPLLRHMAMTDHATLWARVFGVKLGEVEWIDDYFAGKPLAPTTKLPEVTTSAAPMSRGLVALGLLGALCVMLLPGRLRASDGHRFLAVSLLVVGLAALLGSTFIDYRPLMYSKPHVQTTVTSLAWGVPFALAARFVLRPQAEALPLWVLWAGGVFLLSPPTVYRFGGFVASTSAFLLAMILYSGMLARERKHRTALLAFSFAAGFTSLWVAYVSNFKLEFFTFYAKALGVLQWGAVALALFAMWWLVREGSEQKRLVDAAFAFGLLASLLVPFSAASLYIVPCVVAAPLMLLAHRKQTLAPLAIACALPAYAFFLGPSAVRIAPLACALMLFALWARLSGNVTPAFRALGIVALSWGVYWTAFGCRVSGFNFTYFYRWLAAGSPVENTWLENALLTTLLYAGLPVLGLLVYKLSAPKHVQARPSTTLAHATLWTHAKLGAVLAFLIGYAARGATIGAAVTADLVMESALWLLVAAVLMIVQGAQGVQVDRPASLPRTEVEAAPS